MQGGPAWTLVWGLEVQPHGAPGGPVSTVGQQCLFLCQAWSGASLMPAECPGAPACHGNTQAFCTMPATHQSWRPGQARPGQARPGHLCAGYTPSPL